MQKSPELTDREEQVIRLLLEGRVMKEICAELYMDRGMVQRAIRSAKDKLGARTLPHLIRKYLEVTR